MRTMNNHADISTIWGDVWLRTVGNWDRVPHQKKLDLIREDYNFHYAGEKVSEVRRDFAGILSKADPNIRRFVNDVAIPMTAISSVYKGSSSTFAKVANTVTSFLIDVAEEFNRSMIPGYSAWADGGTATEIATSAGSDLVLTLVGGKVIKLGWKGTQALGKGLSALTKKQTASITWGMWSDLPKATYKGREYAKIGDYFYSKHAVDYMAPKNMREALNIPQTKDLRGIPSMAVEEAIKYGKKVISVDKFGKEAMQHTLGDIKVFTDKNDFSIIISLRKENVMG